MMFLAHRFRRELSLKEQSGQGRHGEGGRLTLVIRRGGEGARCRADDEQELEASDAG